MVTYMDEGIGEIVDLVQQLGQDENTLYLFTSDNGPTYNRLGGSDSDYFESSGDLSGRKGQMDEGGIRVPLVVRWTGKVPADTTSDQIGAWWCLLPTICEAAGAETPKDIDGISLLPTMLGKPEQQREIPFLYWESAGYGGQQAVRMGKWKGIRKGLSRRRTLKNAPSPLSISLFDLEKDVAESNNLADKHPQVVKQVEQIMQREHAPSDLYPIFALDAEK
ncbi:MAG: sulfatase-like hydrolase/transferase [Planctomycetota bacterium]